MIADDITADLSAEYRDQIARSLQLFAAKAELARLVVDAHGATVAAIPAQVEDWITAAIEQRDQRATDEAIAWIFANSPQRDEDPALCRLTSMISRAARG